jgi:hypothetical protein
VDSGAVSDPLLDTLTKAVIGASPDAAITQVLKLEMFSAQTQAVRDHLTSDLIRNLERIEEDGVIRDLQYSCAPVPLITRCGLHTRRPQ